MWRHWPWDSAPAGSWTASSALPPRLFSSECCWVSCSASRPRIGRSAGTCGNERKDRQVVDGPAGRGGLSLAQVLACYRRALIAAAIVGGVILITLAVLGHADAGFVIVAGLALGAWNGRLVQRS